MAARSYGHSTDTKPKITEKLVAKLQPPMKGSRILYDSEVRGFGVCLTAGGAVSLVLKYRVHAASGAARWDATRKSRLWPRAMKPSGCAVIFETVRTRSQNKPATVPLPL
jgi:hypothetical protein